MGRTAALSGERLEAGESALRKYIAAGRFDPSATEAHAHFRLGMILEQRHDAARARTEYETALRLDSTLVDAKRALARSQNAGSRDDRDDQTEDAMLTRRY